MMICEIGDKLLGVVWYGLLEYVESVWDIK